MKRILAIILIAVTALSLCACAKEERLFVKKGADGNWDITGVWMQIDDVSGSQMTEDDRLTFYPDGTVYSTLTDSTGEYTLFDNFITFDGKTSGLSVKDDTMTLEFGSKYITLKRVALLGD